MHSSTKTHIVILGASKKSNGVIISLMILPEIWKGVTGGVFSSHIDFNFTVRCNDISEAKNGELNFCWKPEEGEWFLTKHGDSSCYE
jgi:hypothetical protein